MHTIVISLGGSLLSESGYALQFAQTLQPYLNRFSFVVVVGGGQKAKKYAEAARMETGSEFYADLAAIKATRENTEKVKRVFGDKACVKLIEHPLEAVEALKKNHLVFSGGFLPGITTDACSVLVAEAVKATKIINASRVGGVYDRDPVQKGAKKFSRLSHGQLIDLAVRFDSRKARTHFIFDIVAAKLAARSNLSIEFVDGRDFDSLKKAIEGRKHQGTVVS